MSIHEGQLLRLRSLSPEFEPVAKAWADEYGETKFLYLPWERVRAYYEGLWGKDDPRLKEEI